MWIIYTEKLYLLLIRSLQQTPKLYIRPGRQHLLLHKQQYTTWWNSKATLQNHNRRVITGINNKTTVIFGIFN